MKKLISLFMAMQLTLSLYSNEIEYSSVGQQFNTVVINVPASLIIKQGDEHVIKVNNMSNERFVYEISNDTLFIKNKYIIDDARSMTAENLKIRLIHPSPDELFQNICIPRGFTIKQNKNKNKSGNQN